jgi:HK97 family phage prohead protease
MKKEFFGRIESKASNLGPRQIRCIASTAKVDRVGDIVMPRGIILTGYRENPVVLRDHDPSRPVGMAAISVTDAAVLALVTFAPLGASEIADEACALAKSGVLRGVSIGFNPIKSSPIRGGGVQYIEWELLEISLVSVPANAGAVVVERSMRRKSGRSISTANTEKLCAARDRLDEAADHLDDVIGDNDGDETKRVDIEIYRRKARLVELRASVAASSDANAEVLSRRAKVAEVGAAIGARPSTLSERKSYVDAARRSISWRY